MYENKKKPLLKRKAFFRRMVNHLAAAGTIMFISLAVGMIGFHFAEGKLWLDAFLESAMLLGGMGPVSAPQTPSGKLFAGLYALYAGLVFLLVAALIITPIFHRVLHHFHWDDTI
ncbi:MAG TPA: hypothetical protein PK299_15965 [Anaerolineales bacterium]|nr:hypothetical protein [Anaerolineales bacterium]